MRELSSDSVTGWTEGHGRKVANGINTACPGCRRPVWIRLDTSSSAAILQGGAPQSGTCPSCQTPVEVHTSRMEGSPRIWLHPDPAVREELTLEGIPELEGVANAYHSACRNFNDGDPVASAVMARTVLEELFRRAVGATDEDKFVELIERFVSHKDTLARPTRSLADAVRLGGDTATHAMQAVDLEDARELLDLFDFLVTLLYLLPARAEAISEQFRRDRSERRRASAVNASTAASPPESDLTP